MLFQSSVNANRLLVKGVVYLIIGVSIFFFPKVTVEMFIRFLGCLLALDGAVNLIVSLASRSKQENSPFRILPRGLGSIFFGAFLFLAPSFVAGFFIFLISFLMIVVGLSMLVSQLAGRNSSGFSLLMVIISILSLLSGFFMLANPSSSEKTIMLIVGGFIAILGLGQIVWSFNVRKHKAQKPQSEEPGTIDAEYEEVE
jgi:uncharacterized membrane protein HdeD (DUF308 family)